MAEWHEPGASAKRKADYLRGLRRTGRIGLAADAAGVAASTPHFWRRTDHAFQREEELVLDDVEVATGKRPGQLRPPSRPAPQGWVLLELVEWLGVTQETLARRFGMTPKQVSIALKLARSARDIVKES